MLGHVSNIERDHIHGDASEDRHLVTADHAEAARPLVGGTGPAQHAVGVAGGNYSIPERALCGLFGAVADRVALRHIAHDHDPGFHLGNRPHRIGLRIDRLAAIKRNARSDEVEMIVRPHQHAG